MVKKAVIFQWPPNRLNVCNSTNSLKVANPWKRLLRSCPSFNLSWVRRKPGWLQSLLVTKIRCVSLWFIICSNAWRRSSSGVYRAGVDPAIFSGLPRILLSRVFRYLFERQCPSWETALANLEPRSPILKSENPQSTCLAVRWKSFSTGLSNIWTFQPCLEPLKTRRKARFMRLWTCMSYWNGFWYIKQAVSQNVSLS